MSKHRLAILPNVTRYDIFASPALLPTVLPFLDGTQTSTSLASQVAKP